MGSTIVSTGERIACDDSMTIFVHGAYNLGAVLETRLCEEAFHPGEGIEHDKGAGGEDSYTLHTAKSATAYGIGEIDFGIIADCSVDYTTTDEVPAIPYHMNPGAYLRNIVCVDPTAAIEPDQSLLIDPSTPGAFIPLIEVALQACDTGNTESFTAATVVGDADVHFAHRNPMKAAYYLADPNAAVDIVAYITNAG